MRRGGGPVQLVGHLGGGPEAPHAGAHSDGAHQRSHAAHQVHHACRCGLSWSAGILQHVRLGSGGIKSMAIVCTHPPSMPERVTGSFLTCQQVPRLHQETHVSHPQRTRGAMK